MRRLTLPRLVTLALLLIFAGCEAFDPNPGPDPITAPVGGGTPIGPPPSDTVSATAVRGANLYAQYCARCHGDSAEGTKIWPPMIQGKSGIHPIVREGRRAMPGFPALSDSAIASIQLFLQSFQPKFENKSGRELYVSYCSSCHGDSALGTKIFAGSIQGHQPILTIVKKGKGDMLPVEVPDSVIEKIQEYLLSFKQIDLKTVSGVEYYARECAKCHGSVGEGTIRGYGIRNPVVGYATWVIRNGRPGPAFYNAMPRYGTDTLSNAQLTEILNWLRSAPHPSDGKGLYERFCANCHGMNARGGIASNKILKKELDDFNEKIRRGIGGTSYSNRTKYMPAWPASEISNAEIDLMVGYVRSLP